MANELVRAPGAVGHGDLGEHPEAHYMPLRSLAADEPHRPGRLWMLFHLSRRRRRVCPRLVEALRNRWLSWAASTGDIVLR